MRRILIILILLLFFALVLQGISRATSATHELLGEAGYQPFIQRLF